MLSNKLPHAEQVRECGPAAVMEQALPCCPRAVLPQHLAPSPMPDNYNTMKTTCCDFHTELYKEQTCVPRLTLTTVASSSHGLLAAPYARQVQLSAGHWGRAQDVWVGMTANAGANCTNTAVCFPASKSCTFSSQQRC
jgi:hypothetical protein